MSEGLTIVSTCLVSPKVLLLRRTDRSYPATYVYSGKEKTDVENTVNIRLILSKFRKSETVTDRKKEFCVLFQYRSRKGLTRLVTFVVVPNK